MMSGKQWLCRAVPAAVSAATLALAQDTTAANTNSQRDEIAALKSMIAAQQQQLDALKHTLDDQQRRLDAPAPPANRGQVASIVPIFPAAAPATLAAIPAIPAPQAAAPAAASGNPCEAPADTKVPAYIRIGDTCVVPVGFMDMTSVWRDKDLGSSIGTNFASIPYNNALAGKLSEFR